MNEFQQLLDSWCEAIVANDAERIAAFAESDWVLAGPEGGFSDAEQFLGLVASGELTHSAMRHRVLRVREYGDVAVVATHGTNEGAWRGVPFAADEWTTEVFVRRPGGWRCAWTALTPNYDAPVNARTQVVTPNVLYADVESALEFLHKAFGFTETLRYPDPAGYVSHAEMRVGNGSGTIMLGNPGPGYANPSSSSSVTVHLHVTVDDVDRHHENAVAAGAVVRSPPEDHAYGERTYSATDPEGHVWTFGQQIADVAPSAWGAIAVS